MANVPISALPQSLLANLTDLTVLVQSGTTYNTPISQIIAATANTSVSALNFVATVGVTFSANGTYYKATGATIYGAVTTSNSVSALSGFNTGTSTYGPTSAYVNGSIQAAAFSSDSNARTSIFKLPDTGSTAQYIYLGQWSGMNQTGDKLRMKITISSGYNATISQDAFYDVYFKTSNGSSTQSGSSGSFYADGIVWKSGPASAITNLRVIQVSNTTYQFYANCATYTGNSIYEVAIADGTWTNSSSFASPSGNYIDLTIYNYIDSSTSASSVANSITFNNGGGGSSSGSTFNGSSALTVSYNTIGASPLAGSTSLTTVGTITTGTWNAGSVTTNSYLISTYNINNSFTGAGSSGSAWTGIGWNATAGGGEISFLTAYAGGTTASFWYNNSGTWTKSATIGNDGKYTASSSTYGPTSANVNGYLSVNQSTVNGTYPLYVNGNVYSTGNFYAASARALKKNIESIENIDAIALLPEFVQFQYKDDSEEEDMRYGFIADDAHEMISGKNKDKMNINSFASIVGLGVKQVAKRQDKYEEKINKLENIIEEQNRKIEKLLMIIGEQ
jgi:Chaperone of endosialidase